MAGHKNIHNDLIHWEEFLHFFHKGDNFCDLNILLTCTGIPSEKESTLKGKNLLPQSFLLEKIPFSEGKQAIFRVVSPETASISFNFRIHNGV